MTVGERLKKLRNELGYTQSEFAEKLGLSRNSIACYEGGTRNMNDYILKNICQTFNVDYNWLTEGKFEMFLSKPNGTIDDLMKEYSIDIKQLPLIQAYLKASPQTKEELLKFALSVQKEGENNE